MILPLFICLKKAGGGCEGGKLFISIFFSVGFGWAKRGAGLWKKDVLEYKQDFHRW